MSENKSKKGVGFIIGLGVIGFIGLFFLVWSLKVVPAGHTGVVTVFGKVCENTLSEGLHPTFPIGRKVINMNNQVQRIDVDIKGASKDIQTINGAVAINFILKPSASKDIYRTVGKGYSTTIIAPAIQETSKAVISRYTAEELVTKRSEVSSEMEDALAAKIGSYGIEIKGYNIINFDFSEEFNTAIEAKQIAQQNALKAQQDLERIKVEAEQKVAQAQAEAESYKLKSEQITEEMIRMETIQKWDGKLPEIVLSDGTTPLMDITAFVEQKQGESK